jgi:hypothetical protein
VVAWFGSVDGLVKAHRDGLPFAEIEPLIVEDFD